MNAYTDYPFRFLGDIPNQPAPIRMIEVIAYDGDKYCDIYINGHSTSIKAGYIYAEYGRFGEVPQITLADLEALDET